MKQSAENEDRFLDDLRRDIADALHRLPDDAETVAVGEAVAVHVRRQLLARTAARLPPGMMGALFMHHAIPEDWKSPLRHFIAVLLPSLVAFAGGASPAPSLPAAVASGGIAALLAILDSTVAIDEADREILVAVKALNAVGETPGLAELAELISSPGLQKLGLDARVSRLAARRLLVVTDEGLRANV